MKHKGDFALYKGEECLAIGTLKEIAQEVGMKVESVRFMLTPTYAKRIADSKGRKILVAIDDYEDDISDHICEGEPPF